MSGPRVRGPGLGLGAGGQEPEARARGPGPGARGPGPGPGPWGPGPKARAPGPIARDPVPGGLPGTGKFTERGSPPTTIYRLEGEATKVRRHMDRRAPPARALFYFATVSIVDARLIRDNCYEQRSLCERSCRVSPSDSPAFIRTAGREL